MQKNSDSDLYDLISFLATDGAEADHADAFTSSPLTGSEHPAITGIHRQLPLLSYLSENFLSQLPEASEPNRVIIEVYNNYHSYQRTMANQHSSSSMDLPQEF